MLACEPCNAAKADRLPLLLALLLAARYTVTPHVAPHVPDPTTGRSTAHEPDVSGVHEPVPNRSGRVFTVGICLLLARMAAAYESAAWPDASANRTQDQSRGDQAEQRARLTVPAQLVRAADPGNQPTRLVLTNAPAVLPTRTRLPDSTTRPDALMEAA
ncbi:hypothetical protein [Streptomyces sp. IBSBF 2435]|uniref:hypothetical protein n=1 Tax=Streptomyces sp. IBSBF 2435 TaxID=2903531 RepID=UPI002FDBFADF